MILIVKKKKEQPKCPQKFFCFLSAISTKHVNNFVSSSEIFSTWKDFQKQKNTQSFFSCKENEPVQVTFNTGIQGFYT